MVYSDAAYHRGRRQRLREAGLCSTCGQRVVIAGGGALCAPCYWDTRASALRHRHGVIDRACATGEHLRMWYEAQVCHQSGRCPCGAELYGREAVDHDHDTGLLRGLLCFRCNVTVDAWDRIKDWAMPYLVFQGGLAPANLETM